MHGQARKASRGKLRQFTCKGCLYYTCYCAFHQHHQSWKLINEDWFCDGINHVVNLLWSRCDVPEREDQKIMCGVAIRANLSMLFISGFKCRLQVWHWASELTCNEEARWFLFNQRDYLITWHPPFPWPPAQIIEVSSTGSKRPLILLQSLCEATGSRACWRMFAALPPPTVLPQPTNVNDHIAVNILIVVFHLVTILINTL